MAMVANPVVAGLLLATAGLGLFRIFRLIWKKRHVLKIVRETVVDRYHGDFDYLLTNVLSTEELPQKHVQEVDGAHRTRSN